MHLFDVKRFYKIQITFRTRKIKENYVKEYNELFNGIFLHSEIL